MRITRIRNDKELGLAKREVELLKEETGGLETELIDRLEQVEAATKRARTASTPSSRRSTGARDDRGRRRCARRSDVSAAEIERDRASARRAGRRASTAISVVATR